MSRQITYLEPILLKTNSPESKSSGFLHSLRDVALDSALFQPFLTALNTQPDTPTRESASKLDAPVTETPFVPLPDGLDSSMYAALGGAFPPGAGQQQPDTPAFSGYWSGVSTNPTSSTTNLNIPIGIINGNSYPQLSAFAYGSDSSLKFFGGSVTNTQPRSETPGVGSSFQTAMIVPEDLASDIQDLLKPDALIARDYALRNDEKGVEPSSCQGKGGWTEFRKTEVGFVLDRAPNKKIFALMNVVHDHEHKERDPINDGEYIWVHNAGSNIFTNLISNQNALQGLKTEWESKVGSYMKGSGWTLISADGTREGSTFMGVCYMYFGEENHKFCD
ncbi:hypothetical protein MMC07_004802 [Pseudocyphellaria aurata]|nr:hypothetical protein [Pseudocyphellaria aurata]